MSRARPERKPTPARKTRTRSGHPPESKAEKQEPSRQAGDLAAMRRMLELSQGTFSLSFAVCDDRTLRDELIQRLRAEFPALEIVELPQNTPNVYRLVVDKIAGKSPSGIFVLDLEASVPFEAARYQTLKVLNSTRELWERFPCPVVFWLAAYAATRFAKHAPDFWRYRSHQFEFVSDRGTVGAGVREPFPGYEMVDGLPFEEKRFRIAELEARLREAGDPPPRDLLPHVLEWIYELAYLQQHANRFDEAGELLQGAVSVCESNYGSEDTRTAAALNNLAQLLQDTNRFADAEPLMRRALAIGEKSFGPEHPDVARALSNLAQLLQDTNRLADAEPLMRRALAIDKKNFGPEHPSVAIRLNNLAALLQATNRLAEAEPLMARVVTIMEKSLGPEHPNVATALNNLAVLLKATNRLAEAEPLMRRALEIDEKSFGPEHPDVARALNNLAQLLQDTSRLADAEPLMRRALAIDKKSFGPEHPNVAIRLNNLAALLQATNRLAEAEPLIRRALAIDEKSFGPEHPGVARDLNNLAQLLKATNRLADAEPLMRRALAIDEKSFGPEHPDVAIRLSNLALLLQDTYRFVEAEPLMRRALVILRKFQEATGHEHPHWQVVLRNYRGLLPAMGLSEAEIERKMKEVLEGDVDAPAGGTG